MHRRVEAPGGLRRVFESRLGRFPPLLAQEVVSTSVQGRSLVVQCRLSLNMLSLTLEQVVASRQKMLADMSIGLSLETRACLAANTDAWTEDIRGRPVCSTESGAQIRGPMHHKPGLAPMGMAQFLSAAELEAREDTHGFKVLQPITSAEVMPRSEFVREAVAHGIARGHPPEWFNDDVHFAHAFNSAVAIKRELIGRHGNSHVDSWLPDVSRLALSDCMALTALPEALGLLSCLISIELNNCPLLTRLPQSLSSLPTLATLKVGNCFELCELPSSLGHI